MPTDHPSVPRPRTMLALAAALSCSACHASLGIEAGAGFGDEPQATWGWEARVGADLGSFGVGLVTESVALADGGSRTHILLALGWVGPQDAAVVPEVMFEGGTPLGWESDYTGALVGVTAATRIVVVGRREVEDRNHELAILARTIALSPFVRYSHHRTRALNGAPDEPDHRAVLGVRLHLGYGSELLPL